MDSAGFLMDRRGVLLDRVRFSLDGARVSLDGPGSRWIGCSGFAGLYVSLTE